MTYVLSLVAALVIGAPQTVDKIFAAKAAQANMAEIRLGRLAEKNGNLDSVKMFGSHMVADHTRVLNDLRDLCRKKGVALPSSITSAQRTAEARLSRLRGKSFDKAYATLMVANHQRSVALYGGEAKRGKDAELRQLAASKLPGVQDHLKMAKEMHKQVSQVK